MTKHEFDIINAKLNWIIETQKQICCILEQMHDDSLGIVDVERKNKQLINTIREMEIERFVEQLKK